MPAFIFITSEGATYQPNTVAQEPDVENCQVLGFARGSSPQDAFRNLLQDDYWLLETSFDSLQCIELKHEDYETHIVPFSLREE